jgi:hypothetical protein
MSVSHVHLLHTVGSINQQDVSCVHSCLLYSCQCFHPLLYIYTSGDQRGSDKPTITAATAALIANAAASAAAAAAAASANDSSTFLSTEEIKKQLEAHRKALLIKYVAKLTHPGMYVT